MGISCVVNEQMAPILGNLLILNWKIELTPQFQLNLGELFAHLYCYSRVHIELVSPPQPTYLVCPCPAQGTPLLRPAVLSHLTLCVVRSNHFPMGLWTSLRQLLLVCSSVRSSGLPKLGRQLSYSTQFMRGESCTPGVLAIFTWKGDLGSL